MFDTHCHLNFNRFTSILQDVIIRAEKAGLTGITVPGTDIMSSQKAIELAHRYDFLYAAVGIHPHHAFEIGKEDVKYHMQKVEELIRSDKVVAVGEIGLDTFSYAWTKYSNYRMSREFFDTQKELFIAQIKLANRFGKAVILHNRQAKRELIDILLSDPSFLVSNRFVFHCCEPDILLLEFAKKHRVFIGVDGDITYNKEKQEFIKLVPLELLVLETDAPNLLPEPYRTQKKYPNEPAYLSLVKDYIAKILGKEPQEIDEMTTSNACRLYSLPENK